MSCEAKPTAIPKDAETAINVAAGGWKTPTIIKTIIKIHPKILTTGIIPFIVIRWFVNFSAYRSNNFTVNFISK